ncbi:MAG TPA: hypothetical protein VIM40_11890 [Arthrobacter sp.]|jgi:hypothetical protein
MRKMTMKNKVLAAAGALALVAGGGGAAFAYWTTSGSGSGSAANESSNGTLVLSAEFDPGLVPGNSAVVTYKAANANTTGSKVNTLSATVDTTGAPGCLAAWFTVTVPTVPTGGVLVPAGAGGSTRVPLGTGTLTFLNDDANQDLCKGATITVKVNSN